MSRGNAAAHVVSEESSAFCSAAIAGRVKTFGATIFSVIRDGSLTNCEKQLPGGPSCAFLPGFVVCHWCGKGVVVGGALARVAPDLTSRSR